MYRSSGGAAYPTLSLTGALVVIGRLPTFPPRTAARTTSVRLIVSLKTLPPWGAARMPNLDFTGPASYRTSKIRGAHMYGSRMKHFDIPVT